jgi:hypothetical protein
MLILAIIINRWVMNRDYPSALAIQQAVNTQGQTTTSAAHRIGISKQDIELALEPPAAVAAAEAVSVIYSALLIPINAEHNCPPTNGQGCARGLLGIKNKITAAAPIDAMRIGELEIPVMLWQQLTHGLLIKHSRAEIPFRFYKKLIILIQKQCKYLKLPFAS